MGGLGPDHIPTPLSCALGRGSAADVRTDLPWSLLVGSVGADGLGLLRCWDLSSGNKKWIIQVPILASIVVSKGPQGQAGVWTLGPGDQPLMGTYIGSPGPQG